MHIKLMKWLAAATLLLAGLALPHSVFQLVLEIVVCIAALLVFSQTLKGNNLIWAAGLLAIAIIYNPVVPIRFSSRVTLWLDWLGMMTFFVALVALKRRPQYILAPVRNPGPGSKAFKSWCHLALTGRPAANRKCQVLKGGLAC
jgi:hypothetical protein